MIPIVLTINSDGDRFFVEKLYLQYRKNIYAAAFKILKHREDAEDCVQDVIKTVIGHVDKFRDVAPEELAKLLAVCTRNAAINIYRKNRKKKDNESRISFDSVHEEELLREMKRTDDQNKNPAVIAVNKESKQRLAQIISELDDIYRDVLVLRVQYKLNNREIADILKISPNTVNVRLHRAKKILLEERGAELDEIRKNGSL